MNTVIQRAARYVTHLYRERLPAAYTYHNLAHTQAVVRAADMIGLHEELSTEAQQLVTLAAWFHDVGYLSDAARHEYHSERLARAFLALHHLSSAQIETVAACIRATRMPQMPDCPEAAVLCDADLYYLSTSTYPDGQQRLRDEWAGVLQRRYTDDEWRQLNGVFFSQHRYHTAYGRTVLAPRKKAQFAEWLVRGDQFRTL